MKEDIPECQSYEKEAISQEHLDIEKEKLKCINEINKAFDDKLQSSLRIFRFAVWSVSFSAFIVLGSLTFFEYKGYKDIQRRVEQLSQENAKAIISSAEFRSKIDETLGLVVEKRIVDLQNISKKIDDIKTKIDSHDIKEVVHKLFSTIEPRLVALEKLERRTVIEDNQISFANDKGNAVCIQYGRNKLKKSEFKTTTIGSKILVMAKIPFKKAFTELPQVFAQINNASHGDPFIHTFAVESVSVSKDSFFISSIVSAVQNIKLTETVDISWIAIGK